MIFGACFDGFQIQIPTSHGTVLSTCRFAHWQDSELNWWSSILPSAVSPGDIDNVIETNEQMMGVVQSLYQRRKTASLFRYAVVGMEITPFDTFSQLMGRRGADHQPFHGLALSRKL
jgi:hypothetical protein